MKKFIFIILAGLLFLTSPLLAQSSQAYSGGSSSIFSPKEGKAAKKSSINKRRKKAYKATSKRKGLFAKKKGSDCDCPGSPKAKKKRRR